MEAAATYEFMGEKGLKKIMFAKQRKQEEDCS